MSKTKLPTVQLLTAFVNERPGLDRADYSDSKSYNSESREITQDRNDYFELLSIAVWAVPDFEARLTARLLNTGDRLHFDKTGTRLVYDAGQYHPTEYRPAACRVLASLIWEGLREEKDAKGQPVYKNGHEIRKAAKRNLSRRTANNYFN